jgi:hypothetical protein
MEFNYFTMQKYNSPKNKSSIIFIKKTQNPSRYYNSIITHLNQVSTQAKISSFKNPRIKIDLLFYYLGAKIP